MIDSGTLGMLVRTIFVTGAMIGALLLLARAAKKGRLDGVLSRWGANRSQDGIQVTSRAQVSKDAVVVTVLWAGREYLVAFSSASVQVISERLAPQQETQSDPDFQTAFLEASSDRRTEDQMAATLATAPLIERLRHMTSRHLEQGK